MRKTSIVSVVSLLLILGFSSGALAVTDGTGEAFVGDRDLESAAVLLYPPPSDTHPEWARLSIGMASGSSLPGMIIWDFDADENAATGGGSSLNMPFPPCPPTRCKTDTGFDFYVVMVLRDQSDTSQNAYCKGCVGGATCVTRGAPHACDPGETVGCFEAADSCSIGQPGCYVLDTTACSGSEDCENSYLLNVPCALGSNDCENGMQWGEYYVGSGQFGANDPIFRGRVHLEGNILNDQEYCFHLPWGDIVAYSSIANVVEFTAVTQTPQYQVQAWHDPLFDPGDGDDMFDAGLVLNLSDYVPDAGKATDASVGAALCSADSNADCKVNLTDLVAVKAQFLRNDCPNCCP